MPGHIKNKNKIRKKKKQRVLVRREKRASLKRIGRKK